MNKDLKQLMKKAQSQGWRIEPRNGGHIAWFPPDGGEFVITGSTPGNTRSFNNDRSLLRRAGLAT